MTDNPFAGVDEWKPGDGFLASGDHLTEILEIDGTTTSSGGHPQIEVRTGNEDGSIRDWIVVIPTTLGKVVNLTRSAGLEDPPNDVVKAEGTGYRLDDAYLKQLVGRKVGTIVRPEPDRNDPTKTRDRVQGYVSPDSLAESDVPANTEGMAATGAKSDDDIPF